MVKLQVDILLPASPADAGTIAGLAALLATCRAAVTAAEAAQDIPASGTDFATLLDTARVPPSSMRCRPKTCPTSSTPCASTPTA